MQAKIEQSTKIAKQNHSSRNAKFLRKLAGKTEWDKEPMKTSGK